jgi:TRAP-type C4-dicarboxylate transport system permease small subunit
MAAGTSASAALISKVFQRRRRRMTDNRGGSASMHLDENAEAEAIDVSDVRLTDVPGLILFVALSIVVFLQFFTRYVLNDSIGWTEEIARYLLIGVTFVGCVTVTRKGTHIAVELLEVYLPDISRKILRRFIDLSLIAIYAWLAWTCGKLAMRTTQMMVSVDLPKSIIYWVVAAALALMAIYQTIRVVNPSRAA